MSLIENTFQRPKGITEKVADYIKGKIQNGQFLEGEKIPGEREMALELEVSRNTVREAYKILEAYGYLIARHGSGFYIASHNEQIRKMTDSFILSNSQITDLYAVRRLLEEKIAELAAVHRKEEDIAKLEEIIDESMEVMSKDTNPIRLAEYDSRFHLLLAEMSGNAIMHQIMHHLIDLLSKARTHSAKIPNRAKKSVMEHQTILEAVKDGNQFIARASMKNHLDSVEKSVIEYYQL